MNDIVYIIYFIFQHTYSTELQLQNIKYIQYTLPLVAKCQLACLSRVKEATKLVTHAFE
jgi:hypothetical protein